MLHKQTRGHMNTGTVTIPTEGGAEGDNVIKLILALFPLEEQLPLSSAICSDAQVIPNMHLLNDKIKKKKLPANY